jgi:hypothetical protein
MAPEKESTRVRAKCFRLSSLVLLVLTTVAPLVHAKDKKPKAGPASPKDDIEVVGHIPLTDGTVRRFLATQHYSSTYLYAEHDAGTSATLIDVTRPNKPTVLANVPFAPNGGSDSLTLVAGTAALVSSEPAASGAPLTPPRVITIMDFSDPQNPRVARVFTGVTAMSRDDRRGLIFVANADGIWILLQHLALDPEMEAAYEHNLNR